MAFSLIRYSQQDPRWKDIELGSGPDSIGYFGCALTSVAMLSSGWGFTETPLTLNQKLKANGGFVHEAIVWAGITQIYPALRNTGLTLSTNPPAPISQINSSLASGQPVILEVDFSPAPGLQTHWIVAYAPFGSDYLILDPWPYPSDTGQVTLLSRFSHGRPLASAIKAVAWYECDAGAPTTPPTGTGLYVRAVASASAGLRLHPEPSIDSPANYAEMPGVPLQVIEDNAAALAKIGQQNQWIQIRDPNGHTGYVAAWFVEQVPSVPPTPTTPPPAPTPAPEPPPAPAPKPAPPGEPARFQVVVRRSVGAGGLVVRAQPSKVASRVNVEKAGARLTVLEPASTGLPKVGVAGQWLSVKATNNHAGYVAAQYIQLKS